MKIYQKGFSQEESDSSNLLLSLMKRIEDVTILKFVSLEKQGHNGFDVSYVLWDDWNQHEDVSIILSQKHHWFQKC